MSILYVPRSRKEFDRVTSLLCELNINWLNKSGCGLNIEIEPPPDKPKVEIVVEGGCARVEGAPRSVLVDIVDVDSHETDHYCGDNLYQRDTETEQE